MRRVVKRGEPSELQSHRRGVGEPPPSYREMPTAVKDTLRDGLLAEQGWLCCYCMRRIGSDDCRVEHWAPQALYPARQLDYRNLFAACSGDLGGAPHCDVSKGRTEVTLHPLTVDARWFAYPRDGRIVARRPAHAKDIEETLRLNTPGLTHRRRTFLTAFLGRLGPRDKAWSRARLEQALARVTEPGADGRLHPFCEALAYWVHRRLQRA